MLRTPHHSVALLLFLGAWSSVAPSIATPGERRLAAGGVEIDSTPRAAHSAATIHVPGDFPTIEAAVAAASPGDLILIAPGVYAVDNLVIDKPLSLEGEGGAAATILDGDGTRRLATVSSSPVGCIGLTWSRGSGQPQGFEYGAITVTGSLSMQDCVIRECSRFGVYALAYASLELIGCEVRDSNAPFTPAAIFTEGASLEAVDCLFSGNAAAVMPQGVADFTRCDFVDNEYGIRFGGGVFRECSFSGNEVALLVDLLPATILDSELRGNQTALRIVSATVQIGHTLIADNADTGIYLDSSFGAPTAYAGIHLSTLARNGFNVFIDVRSDGTSLGGEADIAQTIVAFAQSGRQIDGPSCEGATVSCSLIHPPDGPACYFDAGGNVFDDPLFCDAPGGDYRVEAGSPALGQACGVIGAFDVPCGVTAVDEGEAATVLPLRPYLGSPRPNPLNPITRFSVGVVEAGPVEVRVLDASGRLVRILVDAVLDPGVHNVTWDGRSEAGRRMPSGQYFVVMQARGVSRAEKVVMVK